MIQIYWKIIQTLLKYCPCLTKAGSYSLSFRQSIFAVCLKIYFDYYLHRLWNSFTGIVSFTVGLFEEFNSVRVQGKKLLCHFNKRNQDLSKFCLKLGRTQTCTSKINLIVNVQPKCELGWHIDLHLVLRHLRLWCCAGWQCGQCGEWTGLRWLSGSHLYLEPWYLVSSVTAKL